MAQLFSGYRLEVYQNAETGLWHYAFVHRSHRKAEFVSRPYVRRKECVTRAENMAIELKGTMVVVYDPLNKFSKRPEYWSPPKIDREKVHPSGNPRKYTNAKHKPVDGSYDEFAEGKGAPNE